MHEVFSRMADACKMSGRPPDSATLMAVTKTRSVEEIEAAIRAGVTVLGENRVQEGLEHIDGLAQRGEGGLSIHFIGRLQSNKAKRALHAFDSIDSVDSEGLAVLLSRLATEAGILREVLLEVNLGEESQKGGVSPEDAPGLAETVGGLPGLALTGLMGVCPYGATPEASRPYYANLRELFDRVRRDHSRPDSFRWLSMGMSHDYTVAIEEGATLVRVGQALFGPRRLP